MFDFEEVSTQDETLEGVVDVATLGGGCFWCVEAVLSRLDGVECAVPGYCGGAFKHPTYEQVCRGITGHAEVVRVQFHPNILSYQDLLDVFLQLTIQQHRIGKGTM